MDLADPELVMIINIPENKFCNDCQKKNPRWCSINNAILLCASCTRKHRKYNKNISTIKSLEGDLWTKDEIKKLYIGGNERFNKLLSSYNIPLTNENAEYKYHTKIAGYYRNLLNEELKGKKVISLIKPSLKEGIELISKEDYDKLNEYVPSQDNVLQNNNINNSNKNNDNNFSDVLNVPETPNQNIFANPFASDFGNNNNNNLNNNNNNFNNNIHNNNSNNNRNNNSRNNNNIFNENFEQHLNEFADSVSNVFTNISHKASNIDYNQKLKNAGEYIMDKKEKIENSETFKGFMSALSSGINTLVRKTEDFFNDSLDNNLSRVNNDNSQQRSNVNRFDNRNMNPYQNQFQEQIPNNNLNMNPYQNQFQEQIPYNNMNNSTPSRSINNNDNNANININQIDLNIETPDGDPDIPPLIEYENNPQNIDVEGEQKNNDNNVENLDQNNNGNNVENLDKNNNGNNEGNLDKNNNGNNEENLDKNNNGNNENKP